MDRLRLLLLITSPLALFGCASAPSGPDGARGGARGPTALRVPPEETPEAVRRIEAVIDTPALIKAEDVVIYASRNYEWDVALMGDQVEPHRRDGEEAVSVARGNARARFRNLDIRAWRSITFRKSGLDVVPFIRITARGRAIYIRKRPAGPPVVRRAHTILVENEDLRFVGRRGEDLPDSPRPAAAPDGPGGVRQP